MTDFDSLLRSGIASLQSDNPVEGITALTRIVRNSEGKYGRNGMLRTTTLAFTPEQRLAALITFFEFDPESAEDALIRVRDSLLHLSGKEILDTKELISQVAMDERISSRIRTETAVFLYNSSAFHLCYPAFEKICRDESTEVEWQVEAARFLYVSGTYTNREIAQNVILGIIDSDAYPSGWKYRVIASFIKKTGVASFFNGLVRTHVDNGFVSGLQNTFFFNPLNAPTDRILSGQWILQHSIDDDEKTEISKLVNLIARDESLTVAIRADAADVLINYGFPEEMKSEAMILVSALGDEGGGHVFSNSQNVHHAAIAASVEAFIFKMVAEGEDEIPLFRDVFNEVTKIVKASSLDEEAKRSVYRSLNRLSVDSATYTSLRIPIADIFVHVWVRIQNWKDEVQRLELEKRLMEELIEMSDTCSSGHAARLINALASYDFQLRIGFDDQIASNISGRLEARSRKLLTDKPDSPEAEVLSVGMLPDATPESKTRLLEIRKAWIADIRVEMQKEFVGGGYLSKKDFASLFEEKSLQWLSLE